MNEVSGVVFFLLWGSAVGFSCAQDGTDYSYAESITGNVRTVTTNHCPNHPYFNLNPNNAFGSSESYTIPSSPIYVGSASGSTVSSAHIDLSQRGGGVGILFNAAFLYSPYGGSKYGQVTSWETSATYAEGNSFDQCGCHGSSTTKPTYHAHVPPPCLLRQLGQSDGAHSPQIGWAFDGFPIYGPRGPNGVMMQTCTEAGLTYGTDVCTDDCGGYYSADGSIDNYVYRYYMLGEYHDGTSCDAPGCPSPSRAYFPNSPLCFRGCCPSGISCETYISKCPGTGTINGFTGTPAVPTINGLSLASGLPLNNVVCPCSQVACKTPCASNAWSKQACGGGNAHSNSCPAIVESTTIAETTTISVSQTATTVLGTTTATESTASVLETTTTALGTTTVAIETTTTTAIPATAKSTTIAETMTVSVSQTATSVLGTTTATETAANVPEATTSAVGTTTVAIETTTSVPETTTTALGTTTVAIETTTTIAIPATAKGTTSVFGTTPTEAMVTIPGSFTLTSAILTKPQVEAASRASLAQEFGVDQAYITVAVAESRRLKGLGEARHLAGSWTVTFSIRVLSSESAAGVSKVAAIESDPAGFSQVMKTQLQALGVSEADSAITITNFRAADITTIEASKTKSVGNAPGFAMALLLKLFL